MERNFEPNEIEKYRERRSEKSMLLFVEKVQDLDICINFSFRSIFTIEHLKIHEHTIGINFLH